MTEKSNQSQIIDVKQAVFIAWNHIQSFDQQIGAPLQDLLLEEFELTDDRKFWLITLGFNHQIQPPENPLGINLPPREERKYKIIKVSAETGEVESMKIREL